MRLKKFARLLAEDYQGEIKIKSSTKTFKTFNLYDLKVTDLVDLERFLQENDFYNFCRIFVNRKWWQTIHFHNLPLILKDYREQNEKIKEDNQWIFNPPRYGEPEQETIGSELRKEFVEEFGSYAVLMDKIQAWDRTGFKNIEQWKSSEFFFWANYLSGQKIVENVK